MRGDDVDSKPVFKRKRLCLNNIGASLLPIVAKLSEVEQHIARPDESTTKSKIEIPKSLRRDIERSKETLAKKQNSFTPFIEVEQLQQGTDLQSKQVGGVDEPVSNLSNILTTKIMIVHSNQQLVAEISSHLLLQLVGSAVVFAPDLNFASKLMMQQDFDLIVFGEGMADDKCEEFRKALKGAKSSLILITLGPSKARNSAALNLLGYRAVKALELAGKPCGSAATARCPGPIPMPFQHLKQDSGSMVVSSSCFSRLSMAIGLAGRGQNLSESVLVTLLALSNNPSNLESH